MSRLQCHLINQFIIALVINGIKRVQGKGAATRGAGGTGEGELWPVGCYIFHLFMLNDVLCTMYHV